MERNILKVGMVGVLLMILSIPSVVVAQGTELPGFRLFDTREFITMVNPNKDKLYRVEIVTDKMNAKEVNGVFAILPPPLSGVKLPYHLHKERESILLIISGTGIETVDGKKIPIKAGDVLFILPGVKHTIESDSDKEIRYVEFYTHPPILADFVEVKE